MDLEKKLLKLFDYQRFEKEKSLQRVINEVEQKYAPPAPKPTSQLKCPVCGSDNIERITTIDRGVSVAMVGLASGKIGKQYKCKKCKHMW